MALNRLKYSSDYPMDYIVYKREYSTTVAAYGYAYTRIAHGLGFAPLLIGQWSTNANFSPSYDLGVEIPNFRSAQPEIANIVGADSTYIYFNLTNNRSSSVTFRYRLMGYANPSYTGEVNIYEDSSNFKFNSDNGYHKLYAAGSRSSAGTITHSLGYIPQARVWDTSELFDRSYSSTAKCICPARNQYATDWSTGSYRTLGAKISSSTLSLSGNNTPFYYHIYGDAA